MRSHSRLCVSQHRWLNAIGQKKAPSHSFMAIARDTHTGESLKSSGQAYLFGHGGTMHAVQYSNWAIGANGQNLRSNWVCCAVILWNSSLGFEFGSRHLVYSLLLRNNSKHFLHWCTKIVHVWPVCLFMQLRLFMFVQLKYSSTVIMYCICLNKLNNLSFLFSLCGNSILNYLSSHKHELYVLSLIYKWIAKNAGKKTTILLHVWCRVQCLPWVRSHAPSIRSHRGTKVVWPDFQPMRVPEEPVCIDLFR